MALLVANSSIAPQLTSHKVTGGGAPLFIEVHGAIGLNLDCSDFPMVSVDWNENTVMTQPTIGDYVAAILSGVLSYYYGSLNIAPTALVSTLLDLLNAQIINPRLGFVLGDLGANIISQVTGLIQRLIDGEPLLG